MNKIELPKEFRTEWLTALRSGLYKQGKNLLVDDNGKYCCLGVACLVAQVNLLDMVGWGFPDEIFNKQHYDIPEVLDNNHYQNFAPTLVMLNDGSNLLRDNVEMLERYGITELKGQELRAGYRIQLNFEEIADLIEQITVGV